jgi:hypothetical protein
MAESNPTVEPNERWIEMCACDGPKEIRYSSASIMSEQKKVPKGISVGIHGPPPHYGTTVCSHGWASTRPESDVCRKQRAR